VASRILDGMMFFIGMTLPFSNTRQRSGKNYLAVCISGDR